MYICTFDSSFYWEQWKLFKDASGFHQQVFFLLVLDNMLLNDITSLFLSVSRAKEHTQI